jgi:hypothetical protein
MPRLRYPKRLDSGESSFLSIPTRMDAKLVRDFGGGARTWANKLGEGIVTFGKKWLHRDLKFGHSSQPVLP